MKNIIKMNTKIIISFLVIILSSNVVMAQWAGEDKKIAREKDDLQSVSIGVQDPNEGNTCYSWTGPRIFSDPSKSVITVCPVEETNVYHVTRVSKYGVEEDQVIVKVIDDVLIVSVTPKFDCYGAGDVIELSDFTIITDPEGYENDVRFHPNRATTPAGASVGEQTITFVLEKNNHTDTKTAQITVVDDGAASGGGTTVNYMSMKENIENMQTVSKALDRIIEGAKVVEKISPCSFDVSTSATGPSVDCKDFCCDNKQFKGLSVSVGTIDFSASYSCRFPFYGIPGIASADVLLGLSFSLSLAPCTLKIIPDANTCSNASIGVGASFQVSGGVGVSVGGGEVLSADLTIAVAANGNFQWNLINNTTSPFSMSFPVTAVGEIELISLVSYSTSYTFFQYNVYF